MANTSKSRTTRRSETVEPLPEDQAGLPAQPAYGVFERGDKRRTARSAADAVRFAYDGWRRIDVTGDGSPDSEPDVPAAAADTA